MNNLIFSNNNSTNYKVENPKKDEINKKHFDFCKYKNNTIKSLNDVECFLCNFNRFTNYIKLYKILK